MSKHTLAPWVAIEWSGGWTVYGGRLAATAGVEVARISPAYDERERNEADARLITAAPDLLAACEAALQHIDAGDAFTRSRTRETLIAAIAKARSP